jgi:hypothetical protein
MKIPLFLGVLLIGHLARAGPVALRGTVTDPTGTPLHGATVTLKTLPDKLAVMTAKTDAEGEYDFRETPDGSYEVEATMSGFTTVCYRPVQLKFPGERQMDFSLPVKDIIADRVVELAEVVGVVTDGKRALEGVKICLHTKVPEPIDACTTSNGLGQYYLAVYPGRYTLIVSRKGSEIIHESTDLKSAKEYRDLIKLPAASGVK